MLLTADVAARALFSATDHAVIQRVGGGVEMFSYRKPARSVSNAIYLRKADEQLA